MLSISSKYRKRLAWESAGAPFSSSSPPLGPKEASTKARWASISEPREVKNSPRLGHQGRDEAEPSDRRDTRNRHQDPTSA